MTHVLRVMTRVVEWGLLALLTAWQMLLSPLLGPACRFQPSCSRYAAEAIRRHGPVRGLRLAAGRLARCHPFRPGGLDPVPEPGPPEAGRGP